MTANIIIITIKNERVFNFKGEMMRFIKFIVLLLVIIGALNWGFWGLFQYDLISDIFGGNSTVLARLVYTIIGIAGLLGISFFFSIGICKCKGIKCICDESKEEEEHKEE